MESCRLALRGKSCTDWYYRGFVFQMEIGYLWLIPMIFLWTVRWTPITNSYQLILAWEKWDGASVGWNARTQSQTGNWNTLNQKNVYQSGMGISRFIVQVCVMVFMVYHGNSLYYIYIYYNIYILSQTLDETGSGQTNQNPSLPWKSISGWVPTHLYSTAQWLSIQLF